MQIRLHPTLVWCLAVTLVVALGIVFVLMPIGWNIIPLSLIALVVAAGSSRLGASWRAVWGWRDGVGTEGPATGRAERDEQDQARVPEVGRRFNRAFGPILAGMIIDLVDFATFGPIGLVLGFPVGGIVGYWMGKALGLSRNASVWCGVAAGIYCTVPGTEFIPLATIAGAYVRFRDGGRKQAVEEAG